MYERLEKPKLKPDKLAKLNKLRTRYTPQSFWNNYKEGILAASALATQTQCKELTKYHRQIEGSIRRAENRLKDSSLGNEEECRRFLSEQKQILSNYNKEVRNKRSHFNEAKWFKDNERMSKQWFSLNKMKTTGTMIKSLFRLSTETETENPDEMLEIAREHHSQLQSEPPLDQNREEAMEDILKGIMRRLDKDEKSNIAKEISFKEVGGTIRKTLNGKAPGPDGIPNEFWKTELKWQDQMKKKCRDQPPNHENSLTCIRPSIAALMTKVFQDRAIWPYRHLFLRR